MGVYEGRGQITKSMKDLMQKWAETKGYWQDAVAAKFEAERLMPLEYDIKTAMGAMDHMAILLGQAKRDASE
ncbi:MAG: hypothetical protein ABSH20_25035 [Tepidisphaeraceae bacterium]|jgi:hypothetical protein